ncbi:unnamed protein product [Paramecium sonneborni]|uniref:Chromo domain-containing protein n=1 Tax=Paramecium sonneborni TaxID=65129 RepID=A0A8S1QPH7_9CILI|nr:unnamed protein product [Paramecium sonneborni]CAD8117679.1 unnamed protein product [Paramecium sonneborni]
MEFQQQQFDVEFVHGKRCLNNIEYYIKWVGYSKSESTWEPEIAFDGISNQLITRFERCQNYKNYHTKIYKANSHIKIRVHIMNKGCQVYKKFTSENKYALLAQSNKTESNGQNYKHQQETNHSRNYENRNDEKEDYDFYIRRGRGRPRKSETDREFLSYKNDYKIEAQKYQQKQYPLPIAEQCSFKYGQYKTEKEFIQEMLMMIKKKEQKKKRDEEVIIYKPQASLPPGYKSQYTDLPKFNLLNQKYYDKNSKCQVSDGKIPLECINSHHLMQNKHLVFKCKDNDEQVCYFDFDTLKSYYPTLLLDYLCIYSIWKK